MPVQHQPPSCRVLLLRFTLKSTDLRFEEKFFFQIALTAIIVVLLFFSISKEIPCYCQGLRSMLSFLPLSLPHICYVSLFL